MLKRVGELLVRNKTKTFAGLTVTCVGFMGLDAAFSWYLDRFRSRNGLDETINTDNTDHQDPQEPKPSPASAAPLPISKTVPS